MAGAVYLIVDRFAVIKNTRNLTLAFLQAKKKGKLRKQLEVKIILNELRC
jgi:hypothetical protein